MSLTTWGYLWTTVLIRAHASHYSHSNTKFCKWQYACVYVIGTTLYYEKWSCYPHLFLVVISYHLFMSTSQYMVYTGLGESGESSYAKTVITCQHEIWL